MKEKNQFYYLILLSFILSIIYPVLVYYGYVRLVKLHLTDVPSWVSSYGKLSKADEKYNVVVFINVKKGDEVDDTTFKSLLDQTVRVDEINIVSNGSIPAHLQNYMNLCYKENDNMKHIIQQCKKQPREKRTRILIVNNGTVYGKDFIEKMIDGWNQQHKKDLILYGGKNKTFVNGVVFCDEMEDGDETILKNQYTNIF